MAASRTYKELITDKVFGAEQITLKAMAESVLKTMDTWQGKIPGDADIELVRPQIERLFARYKAINAPKGVGGAVATAIERHLDDDKLDPRFKSAAEAATRLENLALAGGFGALAGSGVTGANNLFRNHFRAPRGGGRGTGGRGDGGRRGGGRDEGGGRGNVTCWTCGKQGHPARLCPNKKSPGDAPGANKDGP